MKKPILLLLLVFLLIFSLAGCGQKTLAEITNAKKGGGTLQRSIDDDTIMSVQFYGKDACEDGHTNCCYVVTRHYKDSPVSSTGKIMDTSATEVEHIPCSFTENTLTLNNFDNYTYTVEKSGEREYVVFSKPFLGFTSWPINK